MLLLQLLELLPPGSDILLPTLQALQTVYFVASSRCVDVPHGSKGRLHPAGHLSQQSVKIAHPLLVNHYTASLVVRVAVSVHKNVLHNGLREKVWLVGAHLCA